MPDEPVLPYATPADESPSTAARLLFIIAIAITVVSSVWCARALTLLWRIPSGTTSRPMDLAAIMFMGAGASVLFGGTVVAIGFGVADPRPSTRRLGYLALALIFMPGFLGTILWKIIVALHGLTMAL